MLAYRHNNLVYIPITKHASTTFTKLFSSKLNWTKIQTSDIDWDNDCVFAHLIHPYDRHLKGTATALTHYGLQSLVDDPRFVPLWNTAIFDLHSYPLYISFGDNINRINWILLDHPNISGNELTINFLSSHGVAITDSDIDISNKFKNTYLLDKLKSIRSVSKIGTLTYFYDNDVILYYKVVTLTNDKLNLTQTND
jgi:hypothetical protein